MGCQCSIDANKNTRITLTFFAWVSLKYLLLFLLVGSAYGAIQSSGMCLDGCPMSALKDLSDFGLYITMTVNEDVQSRNVWVSLIVQVNRQI